MVATPENNNLYTVRQSTGGNYLLVLLIAHVHGSLPLSAKREKVVHMVIDEMN